VPNNSFEDGLSSWYKNDYAYLLTSSSSVSLQDFFTTGNPIITASLDVPENYFGYQAPFTGQNYLGLFSARMNSGLSIGGNRDSWVAVELSEDLIKDHTYILKFKISKMDKSTASNTDYKVMIAKDMSGFDNDNEDDLASHRKKVYKATISNSSDWVSVSTVFKPESDGYRYLMFKTQGQHCTKEYLAGLYLDEVLVADKCDYDGMNCSPVSGDIVPAHPLAVCDANNPWYVTNLHNVIEATIDIFSVSAQNVCNTIHIESYNGITNPIYWNGLAIVGPGFVQDAAAGAYIAQCHFVNHCVTKDINIEFTKADASSTSQNIWTNYDPTGIEVPIPGCDPYIYLYKITFPNSSDFDFISNNTLLSGDEININSGANILYQAGGTIILSDGFKADNGSIFEAIIHDYNVPPLPLAVNISGPAKGNNSGTYTWIAQASGAAPPYSYDWSESLDGNNYNTFMGNTASITAQLPLDNDLYLKVLVTSSDGQTATADFYTMNMNHPTPFRKMNTDTIEKNNGLLYTLIPNPSSGSFTIQFINEVPMNATIKILNPVGSVFMEKKLSDQTSQQIDASMLPAGMYYVRIQNQTKNYTQKVIIQR